MHAVPTWLIDCNYWKELKSSLQIYNHFTIKMTVDVEVNMYSPQIGQSDSRFLSIHLCFPFRPIAMQTLQVGQ